MPAVKLPISAISKQATEAASRSSRQQAAGNDFIAVGRVAMLFLKRE